MLISFFHWLLISFTAIGFGQLTMLLFRSRNKTFNLLGSLADGYFIGLVSLSFLTSLVWFFFPLNEWVLAPTFLISILGWKKIQIHKSEKSNDKLNKFWLPLILLAFIGCGCLLKSAAESTYYDSGLYYIQTMRWMENYSVVPGLGNVHIRLAMASPWHQLQALFGLSLSNIADFDDLNELSLIWFLVFLWARFQSFETSFAKALILNLFPGILFLTPFLSNASPDLPNTLGLWIVAIWLLEFKANDTEKDHKFQYFKIVYLICFLICSKASALFLSIIILFIFFIQIKEKKLLHWPTWILNSFLFSVNAAKTWILCGYFYFILPKFNFIKADWQILDAAVEEYNNGVTNFARFKDNFDLIAKNKGNSLAWINDWFLLMNSFDKILFIFFFISLVYIAIQFKNILETNWKVLMIAIFCGTFIWFVKAPDIRFHFGAIWLCIAVFFASIVPKNLSKIFHNVYLTLVSISFLYISLDLRPLRNQKVFPAKFYSVNTNFYMINNSEKIYYPISDQNAEAFNDQCWDSPLPCSTFYVEGLEMRGITIQEGFKIRKK